MTRHGTATVLGLLALAWPGPALGAQFQVVDLRPVATGPAVRDLPVVVTSTRGYAIAWRESAPQAVRDTTLPAWLVLQRISPAGGMPGRGDTVAIGAGMPGRPALASGRGQAWIAWDLHEPGMRPGDQDLMLVPHAGFFEDSAPPARLTRERPPGPPTAQASPALLWDEALGRLLLANTWRVPRPRHRGATEGPDPDSTSVEIRTLAPDGTLRERFTVKGPDLPGEARHPALAFLPPGWRERYILAYTSNGGRRELGAAGQSVYLELFGEDWTVLGGRHMAWPVGGAAHPSVVSVGETLYFAWAEPATRDIWLSALGHELWPRRPMRLRDALADSPLGEVFALEGPGLGAPMLFDDFGALGIAFVVTWEWSPDAGRARQEVWMARLAGR